jgi:predicted transcriptional regulator of viral defense system
MTSQPGRDWAVHDLADMLGIKPRNMPTQLGEWTRMGFLAKTGKGRYALPEPVSGLVTAPASP